ncbi:M10 family metallopeptidase C-terminal domain-containing protein [Pseudomonas sp. P7759]|nr:M10 family metallopeptidase C-terminal domain-containing protein [Pseudomonas sp. P7759]
MSFENRPKTRIDDSAICPGSATSWKINGNRPDAVCNPFQMWPTSGLPRGRKRRPAKVTLPSGTTAICIIKKTSKAGYIEDSESHTHMSYLDERHGYMNHRGTRASAPQLDDISAYQKKYGANHETRKDDTTYGFNSNTDRDFLSVKTDKDKMVAAIWDGGGTDTLDFSGYKQDQQISLRAGTFSDVGGLKGNVSIAYGVTIENAVGGSGNDLLMGNEAANTLKGGEGNDRLYGAGGADLLWGGKGNDVFIYGNTSESTHDAPDQIMDFVSGEDRVDVSGIRAALGDKPLKFVSAFSGASGEAVVTYDPVLQMSTLQIAGKPDEPAFVLLVHGKLQQGDIVS